MADASSIFNFLNPHHSSVPKPTKCQSAPKSSSSPLLYHCLYCPWKFFTSQALGGHQNAHKHERAAARRNFSTTKNGNPSNYNLFPQFPTPQNPFPQFSPPIPNLFSQKPPSLSPHTTPVEAEGKIEFEDLSDRNSKIRIIDPPIQERNSPQVPALSPSQ